MNYTPTLTDQDVLDYARNGLAEHLPLHAGARVCTGEDLLHILLGMSAGKKSIHGLCASHQAIPSDATVRHYLNEQLTVDRLAEVEHQINAALASQIPRRVFKRPRDTAMDYHEQAYYGITPQAEGLWVRVKAQQGTTRCYRVATAYLLWRQMRVTLAIRFVLPSDDNVSVLTEMLKRLNTLKYRIKTLFLDRGFDGIRVMRFLSKLRLSVVIACTIRGKTGGTRALCIGRGSSLQHHTFTSTRLGSFMATVAVCRVFTTARRTGRARRRANWMLFTLIRCGFSPKQVRRAYRRRFCIESSYRCARRTRGWTTSPNPVLRFVLIALSFFLLNVWAALRWRFAQLPRQGGRVIDETHFRLDRLTTWIVLALHTLYPPITTLHALTVPIV